MDTRTDSYLVQETLNGNHGAFDHLVRRYMDAVYGLALSRTQNFHHSQDLAQEAFIEAYVHLHRLKDWTKFPNWVFGIASNLCNRWATRRRQMLGFDELDEESMGDRLHSPCPSSPDEDYARKEIREIVQRSLRMLPEKTREAMILFYIDGYSYNDLAGFLGVSVGTVRGRLEYGREKLKGALIDMVEEELKASKPEEDAAAGRIVEQIENLWQNLREALPTDLLKVAAMSREEVTRRDQEIFGGLESSLSPEQKAKMQEQGHLKVEDLTTEQREVLREGAHFKWACELLRPPKFVEELDSFNIEFGDYSSGKRYFAFSRKRPPDEQLWFQFGIEV